MFSIVQGWLVMQMIDKKQVMVLFSNPVSGEEFQLPPLSLFEGQNTNRVYVHLVFSSCPVSSSEFCVVACACSRLVDHRWKQRMSIWKATPWMLILEHETQTPFDEFTLLDGELYATNAIKPHFLNVFNVKDVDHITSQKMEIEAVTIELEDFEIGVRFPYRLSTYEEGKLARDDNSLWLVVQQTYEVWISITTLTSAGR